MPPLRSKTYTPGHRIMPAKAPASSSEPPWWARAPRQGMTAAAEQQLARMETEKPKVASSVKGAINEG